MATRNRITTWQQQDITEYQNSGSMNLWGYGCGMKTSSFQSKIESGYVAVWSTDGNLLEKHISQFATASTLPSGLISSSNQLPNGLLSSSLQVDFLQTYNRPTLVSGSSQISYTQLVNVPIGIISSSVSDEISYNTITSTSSPQTLSSTKNDNFINQGGTQATFTFNLPATPIDGWVSKMTFNNIVTILTVSGNGNSTIGSFPTSAAVASRFQFKFYSGSGWVRIQ